MDRPVTSPGAGQGGARSASRPEPGRAAGAIERQVRTGRSGQGQEAGAEQAVMERVLRSGSTGRRPAASLVLRPPPPSPASSLIRWTAPTRAVCQPCSARPGAAPACRRPRAGNTGARAGRIGRLVELELGVAGVADWPAGAARPAAARYCGHHIDSRRLGVNGGAQHS